MALRIAPSLESLKNGSQAQPQPVNLFDDVVGKATKGLSYVADQTFNPLAQLGNVYEAGKQLVSGTGDILGGAARAVGDVAQGNFQGAAQNAGTALMGAGKVAGSGFRALPVIGGLTENMGTGMARGATEALSGVANVAGGLYNFGKGAITAPGSTKPLEGMQQAVRGASQIVSSPFTAGMSSLPTGAQETLGNVMQPVAQAGEGAFDAAVGGLMQAAGLRYDPQSPETQKLKQVINDSLTVIGGISPATAAGKQGIKTAQIAGKDFGVGVKGVVGGAKDVKNTITNALKKAPSDKVKLSERMIQQMYNLDPKTQKILKSGKNQYVQLADKGLFDSQKAVDFITKPLIKRLDDLSDTGKAYGTMRKSGTVIPDIKSTLLVDTLRDKYGISSVRGKLKVTPDSLVSLGKAEVTRLQEAVDFFNKASKGKMDVNKFLNARKSIDKIARFEAGVDTGTLESIGRTLRKELNKYRPEGLSVLDKTLSTEKNILKNAKKYLLDKEGNIKDSAESFISNLGNANKSAQFKKLAEVVPELQEITDALYALKNIERAGSMYSGGSSAVKQTMGAMLGGSVGGIPGAIAGATATNPGVAVSLLKKLGNSRATKAPVITTPKATKVQVPKVKPPIIKNERVNNLYTTLKVTPPKKTPKVKSMSAKSDNGYITLKAEPEKIAVKPMKDIDLSLMSRKQKADYDEWTGLLQKYKGDAKKIKLIKQQIESLPKVAEPPKVMYHGTSESNAQLIKKDGFKSGKTLGRGEKRQYISLGSSYVAGTYTRGVGKNTKIPVDISNLKLKAVSHTDPLREGIENGTASIPKGYDGLQIMFKNSVAEVVIPADIATKNMKL